MESPKSRKHPHQGKKRPQTPTLAEFMSEVDHLRQIALAMVKADGYHTPMLFTWRRDGVREVVALDLKGSPASMGDVIHRIVKVRDVACFVAVAEAWLTRGPAASMDVPPSQHPEREQVLSISAIHPDGKAFWCYPFAAEGGRVVIGAPISSEGLTLGGTIPSALGGKEDER